MTVSVETNKVTYDCDGSTIEFSFTFKVFEEADLKVVIADSNEDETVLTLTTDYTVSGNLSDGGKITTVATWAAGNTLTITLDMDFDQPTDLIYGGNYSSEAIETMGDRLVKMLQQLVVASNRSILLKISSALSGLELPDPESGKWLYSPDGTTLQWASTADPDTLAVTDFVKTLLDDSTASAFLTTLGFSTFVKTLLDNTTASTFLTTLGLSDFVKTLLDDANAATARATLGCPTDPVAGTGGLRTLGTGAQQAAAGNQAMNPLDDSVAQIKLHTSIGSVGGGDGRYTLPGGEYGFYPQVKDTDNGFDCKIERDTHSGGASYVTNIDIENGEASSYIQQRYVTSSGEIFWIFILRDKTTKEIKQMYQAPDHPCFGNGGKPLLIMQPFEEYDTNLFELVVINPSEEEVRKMKERTEKGESEPDLDLLEIIKEQGIDEDSRPPWPTKAVTVKPGIKKVIPKLPNGKVRSLKKFESVPVS